MPTVLTLPERPEASLFQQASEFPPLDSAPPDPDPGLSVTLATRFDALSQALIHLDEYARADWQAHRIRASRDEGLKAGLSIKAENAHRDAYADFVEAAGAYALIDAGLSKEEAHKRIWNEFVAFKHRFLTNGRTERAQQAKSEERLAYRQRLQGRLAAIVSSYAVEAEDSLGPVSERSTPYPDYLGEGEDREPTLTTRQKLEALYGDRRAGFLPTTHREKNTALELLDYVDNHAHKQNSGVDSGVHQRLAEIYARQVNGVVRPVELAQKVAREQQIPYQGLTTIEAYREGKMIAEDTIRSITQEWGDYIASAGYSLAQLQLLSDAIADTDNPKLNLAQVLAEHTGIDPAPLLRYIDLLSFRETGSLPDPAFDPLRTREIRPVDIPGKNKIVTDVYHPTEDEQIREHTESMLSDVPVSSLRSLVVAAQRDSFARRAFFHMVIRRIPPESSFYSYAQQALEGSK